MLELSFQGFFQCRLATDTDVFNDRRGNLGWTFALGNEPDLDRIIRFNDPVALRTHSPPVAVTVVAVNGSPSDHPLLNARVDFAPTAVFEGRNGAIASDGYEPISPCLCRVSGNGVVLQRQSDYDVLRPAQRAPYMGRGGGPLPDPMVRGTKLSSEAEAIAYREARRQVLLRDLQGDGDPAIIQGRINYLTIHNAGAPTATLHAAVGYGHPLKDGATVTDPDGTLGVTISTGTPWQIAYWMGSWDADTLTGYVRGTLSIPAS